MEISIRQLVGENPSKTLHVGISTVQMPGVTKSVRVERRKGETQRLSSGASLKVKRLGYSSPGDGGGATGRKGWEVRGNSRLEAMGREISYVTGHTLLVMGTEC